MIGQTFYVGSTGTFRDRLNIARQEFFNKYGQWPNRCLASRQALGDTQVPTTAYSGMQTVRINESSYIDPDYLYLEYEKEEFHICDEEVQ